MLRLLLALALIGSAPAATPASPGPVISAAAAQRTFARAHTLCTADAGRLWGVSLCVPMMLVDPQTRRTALNAAVPGATADGAIFRLTLPAGTPIANAPVEYGGVHWAQILWPLSGSSDMQAVTLMHESFHVVQPKLGFTGFAGTGSISGDPFLDTQPGRVWFRGELHALRAALQSTGSARRGALHDALAMRLYRDSLSAATAEQERQLDVMEGLAESTGIDAGLPLARRIPYALTDITFVESQPSYARAFPYATGPAYSELLDAASPNWRRTVTRKSDIARMAMRAYGLNVSAPSAAQAKAIIARYGGAAIRSQEGARATRKTALQAKYTRELIDGPTLSLPMKGFNISFNPRDIEAFGSHGSVYHTLTVKAPWGGITVSGGDAMIDADFHTLTVTAPANASGSSITGQGWKLDLKPGYAVVPDPDKAGSYTVLAHR